MPLKLEKRGSVWYLRGSIRGIAVHESTKVTDEQAADDIRVATEHRLLQESILGKKAVKTFKEASESYLKSGGSDRFMTRLVEHLGPTRLSV
jgi:hypothetical protein